LPRWVMWWGYPTATTRATRAMGTDSTHFPQISQLNSSCPYLSLFIFLQRNTR
jgi:hypothetical protein